MGNTKYSAYQRRKLLEDVCEYIDLYDLDGPTVGLDLSSTGSGVCCLDEDGDYVDSDVIETSTDDGTIGRRIKMMQEGIVDFVEKHDPSVIAWESVIVPQNPLSFKRLSMVLGSLYLTDYFLGNIDSDVFLFRFGNQQLKDAVGASSKSVIVKNVLKKWDIDVDDDNEAEGIVSAKLGHMAPIVANRVIGFLDGNEEPRYNLMMDICKRRHDEFEGLISDLDNEIVTPVMKKLQGKSGLKIIARNDRKKKEELHDFIKSYEKDK